MLVTVAGAAVIGRVRRPAHPDAPADGASIATPSASASVVASAPGLAAPLRAPAFAFARVNDSDAGNDAGSATTPPRMVHGGPRHLHRSAAHGPRAVKVAWRTKVDGAVAAQVTTSPDERTLYVATLAGSLVALARDDGKQRWTAALGERVYSTPLVADDGTVYAGSDAKKLTALSPDGAVLWRLEVDGEADSGPVLARDGTIVFAAGSSVYCVRRGGDVAWRFPAKGKVFTAPALTDDGLVIVGSQDDHVHAIGAGGVLAWSVDLGADVDGAAVIGDDGAIYVGTDKDEVVRLDSHGKIAWRAKVGGYVRGVLSLARNGDVLAGTYGPVPRLVRVAPDGTIRGAFAIKGTGAREFGIHGGPLEDADGTLFFGAQDDSAYAIDTEGAVRWRFETGADVDAPLSMLSDGSLVVASEDGTITMLLP
ncbi:MAG: cell surface protein [Myxococcales bacterium]|nr:cell surface protein [Myxococcales bacterium]